MDKNITLSFQCNPRIPERYIEKWILIKKNIEERGGGYLVKEDIYNIWRGFCELDSNKNLPDLHGHEGGIGGDDNRTDKQMRFGVDNSGYNFITISVSHPDLGPSKWTFPELTDLVQAFVKTLNQLMGDTVCCGFIKVFEFIEY